MIMIAHKNKVVVYVYREKLAWGGGVVIDHVCCWHLIVALCFDVLKGQLCFAQEEKNVLWNPAVETFREFFSLSEIALNIILVASLYLRKNLLNIYSSSWQGDCEHWYLETYAQQVW